MELDTGVSFLANFKYELNANITPEPIKLNHTAFAKLEIYLKDQQKKAFTSICNETMVGFVQNSNHSGSMEKHNIQCFYAEAVSMNEGSASFAQKNEDLDAVHFVQTKA